MVDEIWTPVAGGVLLVTLLWLWAWLTDREHMSRGFAWATVVLAGLLIVLGVVGIIEARYAR